MKTLCLIAAAFIASSTTFAAPYELGSGKTYATYVCNFKIGNGGRYAKVTPLDENSLEVKFFSDRSEKPGPIVTRVVSRVNSIGSYVIYASEQASDDFMQVIMSNYNSGDVQHFVGTYTDKKETYSVPQQGMLPCELE